MTTPAQWAPDPHQPGQLRWWDGVRWTEHTTAATPPQAGYTGGAPQPPYASPYGQYGQYGQYAAPGQPSAGAGWVSPAGTGPWGQPSVYYARNKRGKKFWWSLGVILSVLVLGGGSFFGYVLYRVVEDVRQPERVASAYLGDLANGRYSQAYARLCSEDASSVSLARFTASKQAHHPLSYRVYGANVSDRDGAKTATVNFDETSSDGGGSGTSQLTLESTPTGWRVCHFDIDPDQWASVPNGQQSGPDLTTAWWLPLAPVGAARRGLSG
jgi:hypothetical protein